MQLEDMVRAIVKSFIENNTLFTALDVSNKVKETLSVARHREVRELVRSLFVTDIEPAGWARSVIPVKLEDGSQVTALLYHPLSASWDLDTLYNDQQRAQTSRKQAPSTVSVNDTITVAVPTSTAISMTVPTPKSSARDLWKQMFQGQSSLFPRR